MLKLMPILEQMGACAKSRAWVREKNFDTFSKAWAVCPEVSWIDWLIAKLADDGNEAAQNLWDTANDDVATTESLEAAYAGQRPNLEHWLVEYAHTYGCAVEMSS